MDTIYHIFSANRVHLVPQILKSFYLLIKNTNHVFLLLIDSDFTDYRCYNEIKSNYNEIQLFYVTNFKQLRNIIHEKKSAILFHSLMPSYILKLICYHYVNINVVFWGSGIHILNAKNYFLYPLKYLLYHRFRSIVALMESDKIALKKNFLLKRIYLLPYIGERELLIRKITLPAKREDEIVVYVGNNSSCISSYCYIAQNILKKWSDWIHVEFMLNYNLSINDDFRKLQLICNDYKKAVLNTTFYNLKDYILYMNKCTHYLCNEHSQTGLGAIYTCLQLGKKIFLTGANYDWISSLGCKIYRIEEINSMSYEEFAKPLSDDIIHHNIEIMKKFEDLDAKVNDWNSYLSSLFI